MNYGSVSGIQRASESESESADRRAKIWEILDVNENDRHVLRVNGPSAHGHRRANANDHASDYDRPVHIIKLALLSYVSTEGARDGDVHPLQTSQID